MKKCSICEQTKELTEFYQSSKYKDKLYYRKECKLCTHKNPDSKKHAKKYRETDEYKQKRKEYRQLDHVKSQEKEYRITTSEARSAKRRPQQNETR